jgi:glycosyltransferase involved in cell wall biosynthesis
MDYKISIIIPCYNVEAYLKRCLNSIVNQTMGVEALQLILVNDASTDTTLNIMKEYEDKYPDNILIITYENNMGQGYARNVALDYAVASYIGYIDSDDYIELDMYEKMYEKIISYSCEVVICRNDRPFEENEAKNGITGNDALYIFDTDDQRRIFLTYFRDNVMCTNKLISKDLLIDNNIIFPENIKFEDNYWGFLLLLHINSVYILEECLYHWYYNTNSTVTSGKAILDRSGVQVLLLDECKKRSFFDKYRDEIIYNFYERSFVEPIFYLYNYNCINIDIIKKLKMILLKVCPEFTETSYYKNESVITRFACEAEIRKFIENDVTMDLMDEVKSNIFT